MATFVAGDFDVDVDADVKDYGSTLDKKERVVPSGMMMESPSSSSPPLWKTKKAGVVLLGLLGLTAMVASGGAALVFPSLVTSSEPARTEEAFLLQASVGNDNKCVAATGLPWPTNAVSQNDDGEQAYGASDGPYVTCFTAAGGYCWSHSYYDDGDWKQCTPEGAFSVYAPSDDTTTSGAMGVSGHTFTTLNDVTYCGTGCTGFSSDVPH